MRSQLNIKELKYSARFSVLHKTAKPDKIGCETNFPCRVVNLDDLRYCVFYVKWYSFRYNQDFNTVECLWNKSRWTLAMSKNVFFQKHDVFGIFSYIEAISSIVAFKINLIIMFVIMLIVRHHLILFLCFLHI